MRIAMENLNEGKITLESKIVGVEYQYKKESIYVVHNDKLVECKYKESVYNFVEGYAEFMFECKGISEAISIDLNTKTYETIEDYERNNTIKIFKLMLVREVLKLVNGIYTINDVPSFYTYNEEKRIAEYNAALETIKQIEMNNSRPTATYYNNVANSKHYPSKEAVYTYHKYMVVDADGKEHLEGGTLSGLLLNPEQEAIKTQIAELMKKGRDIGLEFCTYDGTDFICYNTLNGSTVTVDDSCCDEGKEIVDFEPDDSMYIGGSFHCWDDGAFVEIPKRNR